MCADASIRLTVAIPYHCHFGQHLRLVGSTEHLGRWDADHGVVMRWSDGDLWSVEVDLPVECAAGPPLRVSQFLDMQVPASILPCLQVGNRASVQVCGAVRGWLHNLETRVQFLALHPHR